jgi:hypothetical protein
LLETAPGAVPESLNDGWPGIVSGVLKIFRDPPEAIAGAWGCSLGSIETLTSWRVMTTTTTSSTGRF